MRNLLGNNRGSSLFDENLIGHESAEHPRFVVLFHQTQGNDHWDLMLERNGQLDSWAMSDLPDLPQLAGREMKGIIDATKIAPEQRVCAKRLAGHRIEYLKYEGEISGNRGSVTRVMSGSYSGIVEPAESPQLFSLWLKMGENQWEVSFREIEGDQWEIVFKHNQ